MSSASYELRDGVAVITLNNPPVNGLGHEVRLAVAQGLERAMADAAVQAVVITGAGRAFSGGADIKEFGSPKALAEPNLLSLILAVEHCTKPVVAAINGVCMGGGLELSLGCHYRVVAPGVDVALPEVKIGLVPGAGGTQRLSRLIGPARAKELIFTGRMVEADEALRIGMVDRVVPADQVYPSARDWCAQFARGPATALSAAKEAVDRGLDTDLGRGLEIERELFAGLFATEDRTIGMTSFLENGPGKAVFVGR